MPPHSAIASHHRVKPPVTQVLQFHPPYPMPMRENFVESNHRYAWHSPALGVFQDFRVRVALQHQYFATSARVFFGSTRQYSPPQPPSTLTPSYIIVS